MNKLIPAILAFLIVLLTSAGATPPPSWPSIILTPQNSTAALNTHGQCATTSAGLYCNIGGTVVGPYGVSGSTSLVNGATPITGGSSGHALIDGGGTLSELAYGLTGASKLIETTSGGLLTASILPLGTSGVPGAVECGSNTNCTGGVLSVPLGTSSNPGAIQCGSGTTCASGVISVASATATVAWTNCVSQFGADPTGATDTGAAIQNCVNAVAAQPSGGVVYLPTGTYKTQGICLGNGTGTYPAITCNQVQDINLLGDGLFSTAIVPANTSGNFITVDSAHGSIRNLGIFETIATQTSGDMIYVNSGGVTIDTVSSFATGGHTFYNGIHLDAFNSTYYNINNFGLVSCSNNCIQIGEPASTNPNVGGVITNGNIGSAFDGVIIYSSGGMVMTNVDIIQSTSHAIGTFPTTGSHVFALYFTNVFADTSGSDGWYFGTNGGTVADVQMNNCWGSTNNGYGVNIFPGGTNALDGLVITGGDYINNAKSGILINSGARNVTINGINSFNNSVSGAGLFDGVSVAPNTSFFKIVNSQLGSGGATFEQGAPNNQHYGVNVLTGASDFYIVTNNAMLLNVAGSFDGGSGTNKFFCDNLDGNGACSTGGGGSGNVINTTPGAAGNIMACLIGSACTTISPSSWTLNGATSFNVPNGALIGNVGTAIGGIYSTANPSWTGLSSGTISAGSIIGLNGSGQVVLGSVSGTGNVTNSTSGAAGNIMACLTATACTTISPSSWTLNGATSFNVPNGALIGNSGTAIGGIYSTATPSWTGLTSGTIAAGSSLGLNGSGQVVLGPSGSGNVTSTGGASSNIMACQTGPACTTISGAGVDIDGTGDIFGPAPATLGTASFPWADLLLKSDTWTPALFIGGSNVGSYARQQGNFQTLGHVVIASFSIIITSTSFLTGAVQIGNLPITSISNGGGTCQIAFYNNTASISNSIFGTVDASSTTAHLFTGSAAGAAGLSSSNITNSTQLDGSCTYFR